MFWQVHHPQDSWGLVHSKPGGGILEASWIYDVLRSMMIMSIMIYPLVN